MSNPHEKLAMEFFSPPGPSAREWRKYHKDTGYSSWHNGAKMWPDWTTYYEYEIRLKPQTITLPERSIPKPLDVGELVDGETYWVATVLRPGWCDEWVYFGGESSELAKRGVFYPFTDQGKADAIAAAKGMIGRNEG